jgi:CBS domain containing-hemolysin-like protein
VMMFILVFIIKPIEIIRGFLPDVQSETVTRTELSVMADMAEESDVIEEDEEKVIHNLLKLREMEVSTVMTPRVVMNTVSYNETVNDILERMPIMINGRMPMTGESIDDVQGFVLRNEILRSAANDDHHITMKEISREIRSCTLDESVDKALDILLENKVQILIVKDEFGGTSGILTMEDIIETLLGVEIVDESDQEAIIEGDHHEDMRALAKIRFDNESE